MSTPPLQTLFPEAASERRPTASLPPGGVPGVATPEDALGARLAAMSPEQRIEASRAGGFTRHERAVWASRYPEEVPTVNGEFEWLVRDSADLD